MPTFTVTVACTVSAYGTHIIEAESQEDAMKQLKSMVDKDTLWDIVEPEWESADDHRIVDMTNDETKNEIINDLYFNSQEWVDLLDPDE